MNKISKMISCLLWLVVGGVGGVTSLAVAMLALDDVIVFSFLRQFYKSNLSTGFLHY